MKKHFFKTTSLFLSVLFLFLNCGVDKNFTDFLNFEKSEKGADENSGTLKVALDLSNVEKVQKFLTYTPSSNGESINLDELIWELTICDDDGSLGGKNCKTEPLKSSIINNTLNLYKISAGKKKVEVKGYSKTNMGEIVVSGYEYVTVVSGMVTEIKIVLNFAEKKDVTGDISVQVKINKQPQINKIEIETYDTNFCVNEELKGSVLASDLDSGFFNVEIFIVESTSSGYSGTIGSPDGDSKPISTGIYGVKSGEIKVEFLLAPGKVYDITGETELKLVIYVSDSDDGSVEKTIPITIDENCVVEAAKSDTP